MPDRVKQLQQIWQQQTDRFTELVRETADEQPKAGPAGKKKSAR
jgi:hypothetical protein